MGYCTGTTTNKHADLYRKGSNLRHTTSSTNPCPQEDFCQVLQPDQRLMQKSAEAAIVAKETFPKAWLAVDKKQAEKGQKLLLASLQR